MLYGYDMFNCGGFPAIFDSYRKMAEMCTAVHLAGRWPAVSSQAIDTAAEPSKT